MYTKVIECDRMIRKEKEQLTHVVVEHSRKKTNSLEHNNSDQQDRWFALNGANRHRNAEYLIVNTSLAKIKDFY